MKNVQFRPLRRDKKTGKVIVASYSSWRKIKTADCQKTLLTVKRDYANMKHDEFVHNHKGELLYFYRYNPNDIPLFDPNSIEDTNAIFAITKVRGLKNHLSEGYNYSGAGIDCDGIPTFSHFDADYLGTHKYEPFDFEVLTVGTVLLWYEWVINNLSRTTFITETPGD